MKNNHLFSPLYGHIGEHLDDTDFKNAKACDSGDFCVGNSIHQTELFF